MIFPSLACQVETAKGAGYIHGGLRAATLNFSRSIYPDHSFCRLLLD